MKGTLPQKVGRLVTNLALHPNYLARYATHNLLNGRLPLDMEIPWFSYAAIDFLQDYLMAHMSVCEYGSGGSTLFFARRVRSVVAIEDNPHWCERVKEKLRHQGLPNVTVKLAPFDAKNPTGFETSSYLHAIPDQKFDVIVVDGTEEWIPVRPTCFHHAENFVKPGGIIVVDDSWRYPSLRTRHKASRVGIFQSVGPGRPGVTSTDVFFY
jgi:SAM-dependent methyltransferase